jgi:hypothetical protein
MRNAVAEFLPPPAVVRDRLAENYREARMLRSLLKLSVEAAEQPARGAAPVADATNDDNPRK